MVILAVSFLYNSKDVVDGFVIIPKKGSNIAPTSPSLRTCLNPGPPRLFAL